MTFHLQFLVEQLKLFKTDNNHINVKIVLKHIESQFNQSFMHSFIRGWIFEMEYKNNCCLLYLVSLSDSIEQQSVN